VTAPARIEYEHSRNRHTAEGPRAAWPLLFPHQLPSSVLDVGCGTGVWLSAAQHYGAATVFGIDGVDTTRTSLQIAGDCFRQADLTRPFELDRRFDVVLCLEVGEHLPAESALTLVHSLTRHGDCILFSGAVPGQPGQHHVNCQWPSYWQKLFNQRGFACDDTPRWTLWNVAAVEPWYRQNMFVARRDSRAGAEARILPVVHPAMLHYFTHESHEQWTESIARGALPPAWYLAAPFSAFAGKLRRALGAGSRLADGAD
jgi:SAM-dependent methyltransferase